MVGKVLAVDGATTIGIEGREDVNGRATGFETRFSLSVASRQQPCEDTLVGISLENAGGLIGQVSLVLTNLRLSTVCRHGRAILDLAVGSRERKLVDLGNAVIWRESDRGIDQYQQS